MRLIIQRVKKATVTVDKELIGSIEYGILVFLGIHKEDTEKELAYLIDKCINLRIFPDDKGKMNQSLLDIQGELLVVSQFTLYADCQTGRRPSFTDSAPSEKAKPLYEGFVALAKEKIDRVETGWFGGNMQVELVNDGPVTMILEKRREVG